MYALLRRRNWAELCWVWEKCHLIAIAWRLRLIVRLHPPCQDVSFGKKGQSLWEASLAALFLLSVVLFVSPRRRGSHA